ncbi:DNA repair protein RecN [Rubellicoccus peritrichatus]|uniref:DNA repair protein RecN n=1 Tax=Rubellicoccus peritrichatus TaxID=3080537 RepID=A0AAQ3QXV9_9BACT|nr:DNA repair protein RecN [Puniceicoccus sp. CR14]WOO43457.1 DNA repair protein RecN [Puniceicoccus sp. CR14]
MLHYLKVENLALMDRSELEFGTGFTVVTGETGAGKSVLLGALSILAGNRVDKSVIRQGQAHCSVEAILHFADASTIDADLEALGLPLCEEGQLVLRRVIHQQKPARVHINGAVATLASLQSLGESWVDFHGPGEPQKLFQGRRQLELLDHFSGNDEKLRTYKEAFVKWRELLEQAEALRSGERLSADEAEFIRSQIESIDSVDVSEESIANLERDYARIDKAQELAALTESLEFGIGGEVGLSAQIPALIRAAHELVEIDSGAAELCRRLDALAIEVDDLAAEFGALGTGLDIDEETASSIQEQMQTWLSLKRKYGPTVSDVLSKRDALKERLESQGNVAEKLEGLDADAVKQEARLRSLGKTLTRERRRGAKELSTKARKLLARLGFKKAEFTIEIIDEIELKSYGDTICQFLFAPNAGQDLMPLNKIASSGETARVMLALKAVLAAADSTPLLVFDEVDANVGGEIGAEVGRELAALAGAHQVLCVTHLPQVAAYGRQHFVVEKSQSKKSTTVMIKPIDESPKDRETEIARMLGDRKSSSAKTHARELLESSVVLRQAGK